jgi:hypothetical protein
VNFEASNRESLRVSELSQSFAQSFGNLFFFFFFFFFLSILSYKTGVGSVFPELRTSNPDLKSGELPCRTCVSEAKCGSLKTKREPTAEMLCGGYL